MAHILSGILLFTFATATLAKDKERDNYPAEWWQNIPHDPDRTWEIMPQDAGPGEVILSKRTELGIFSNFTSVPVEIDGVTYDGLEGFWQMMKYPEGPNDPRMGSNVQWPFKRSDVAKMSGFDAKRAGSKASKIMEELDINYVTYKGDRMTYRTSQKGEHYRLIRSAMWAKVQQNPQIQELLLKTGDLILKADHKQKPNSPPAWLYNEIYMEFRDQLRKDLKKSH